jgi:hypothetical protein
VAWGRDRRRAHAGSATRSPANCFPTRALGVRLGYARWDGDESLDESYELGATWFFKRSIGAQVVLARTKSPTFPIATVDDADSVAVRLIGRL